MVQLIPWIFANSGRNIASVIGVAPTLSIKLISEIPGRRDFSIVLEFFDELFRDFFDDGLEEIHFLRRFR